MRRITRRGASETGPTILPPHFWSPDCNSALTMEAFGRGERALPGAAHAHVARRGGPGIVMRVRVMVTRERTSRASIRGTFVRAERARSCDALLQAERGEIRAPLDWTPEILPLATLNWRNQGQIQYFLMSRARQSRPPARADQTREQPSNRPLFRSQEAGRALALEQ